MWKEVVPNKETHEDPVVHAPLKVEGKRQAGHGQLSGQVLKAQNPLMIVRTGVQTVRILKHKLCDIKKSSQKEETRTGNRRTSRRTQSLINMNSCSDTGIESANSSC